MLPPCPHFGTCGGCTLQHWGEPAYLAWKAGLLTEALQRAGYAEPPIMPIVRSAPAERRRMDLAVRRTPQGSVTVGFHQRRTEQVVDILTCPVLNPALVALLPELRRVLRSLGALKRAGSAVVNLLDSGPDLLLRTDSPLSAADRTRLAGFAQAHGLPRISWALGDGAPETACLLRPATTRIAGIEVTPPPGAFLQATPGGEAAIAVAMLAGLPAGLPARARIADLFAGSGTLTFALAARGRVAAFEGDAAASGALTAAARKAGLAGRIEAETRDLARRPLMPAELSRFAAVVLDPPFAGAAPQIAQIAAAKCRRVIYVSCNPAALTRDARTLRGAGFNLLAATPIDQFLWSARLESVVVFTA